MVPCYVLQVHITFPNELIGEKEFRELTASSLAYLHSLNGAFDKKPCEYQFVPPECSNGWSLRCVLMISVGAERGQHLLKLYDSIVRLIAFELPDFDIRAMSEVLKFS